jgi:hypothetical protein
MMLDAKKPKVKHRYSHGCFAVTTETNPSSYLGLAEKE